MIGVLRDVAVLALFGEGGRFGDLAANDVAGDDDDEAEDKRNPPAPGSERLLGKIMRERQEYRRGEDLPGLHALKAEAGVVAAPPKRSMLEDHRAGAGDLSGDREALDEAECHQKDRSEHAGLLVGRQERDGHRRETHEKHAQEQHGLAAVRVTPMAKKECADRPGDIADTVGCQRRDNGDLGVLRRKEDLGEDQGGGRCVDEEVIVLQRGADPAAGSRLPGLMRTVWLMFRGARHFGLLQYLLAGSPPDVQTGLRLEICIARPATARYWIIALKQRRWRFSGAWLTWAATTSNWPARAIDKLQGSDDALEYGGSCLGDCAGFHPDPPHLG